MAFATHAGSDGSWGIVLQNQIGTHNQTIYMLDGNGGDGEGSMMHMGGICPDDHSLIQCYQNNISNYVFALKGSGYMGMGVGNTAPAHRLSVKDTGNAGNVALFESNWQYGCKILIDAVSTNGRQWALSSYGQNAGQGAGKFGIIDNDANAERFIIDTSGNCGIGTTGPSYKLEVVGSFYSSGSSIEYKKEVEPYTPPEGALMKLKPVQYKYREAWKDFGKRYAGNSSKQLGLVAEDVAKILPELAVTKVEDGQEVVRNVDYEKLTVLLLSEVQNLRKELDELRGSGEDNSRIETADTKPSTATASGRRI